MGGVDNARTRSPLFLPFSECKEIDSFMYLLISELQSHFQVVENYVVETDGVVETDSAVERAFIFVCFSTTTGRSSFQVFLCSEIRCCLMPALPKHTMDIQFW